MSISLSQKFVFCNAHCEKKQKHAEFKIVIRELKNPGHIAHAAHLSENHH